MHERVAVSEGPPEETIWNAEQLDSYLTLLAYNDRRKSFLLPQEHFPCLIHPRWHETFNTMREATRDHHERWTPIVVSRAGDRVLVPHDFIRSQHAYDGISHDEIAPALRRARQRGYPYFVADLHSHPPMIGPESAAELTAMSEHFSLGDLFCLLFPFPRGTPYAMFLVTPSATKAVFRSRESEPAISAWTQDMFEQFWLSHAETREGQ